MIKRSKAELCKSWDRACWRGHEYVSKAMHSTRIGDLLIGMAEEMLAIALQIADKACPSCEGRGSLSYDSVPHGLNLTGPQRVTPYACQRCQGTGRMIQKRRDCIRLIRTCD